MAIFGWHAEHSGRFAMPLIEKLDGPHWWDQWHRAFARADASKDPQAIPEAFEQDPSSPASTVISFVARVSRPGPLTDQVEANFGDRTQRE